MNTHFKAIATFILVLLPLIISSCFGGGVDRKGSVRRFKNGIVYTDGGLFRVGTLDSSWVRKQFAYRAILFENNLYNSSISVDAFCKGSFDDAPLKVLTNQLFYGMTDQKSRFSKKVILDGREALRTARGGMVDGASIIIDTVVLKMNDCVFDFVYVAEPSAYPKKVSDFVSFYKGFRYIKGP